MKLRNFICGEWKEGEGTGEVLVDPVTGEELARVSSKGIDFRQALGYARPRAAWSCASFPTRSAPKCWVKSPTSFPPNRAEYFKIALANSGSNDPDASFDIDGGIYTIKYYAKLGAALGEGRMLKDGKQIPLSKTGAFAAQHFLMPTKGVAIFINAFNFPAWGFCEKAGPALLSGVPIVIKPATPTAWLTHRMVEDISKAKFCRPAPFRLFAVRRGIWPSTWGRKTSSRSQAPRIRPCEFADTKTRCAAPCA